MKNEFIKRLASFFIDVMVLALILSPAAFLVSYTNQEENLGSLFSTIGGVAFMLKDFYSEEGSFGKEMMGLRLTFDPNVVNSDINYYKVVRNIPLLIWPLEGMIAILNKGRRLGDMIGKSEVKLR